MQSNALATEAYSLFNSMSAAKMHTVIQFARFIAQQPDDEAESVSETATSRVAAAKSLFGILPPTASVEEARSEKLPAFGSLRDKIHYIAPDFDEPLELRTATEINHSQ